eukprot:2249349-Amphidinium_carterae.1
MKLLHFDNNKNQKPRSEDNQNSREKPAKEAATILRKVSKCSCAGFQVGENGVLSAKGLLQEKGATRTAAVNLL